MRSFRPSARCSARRGCVRAAERWGKFDEGRYRKHVAPVLGQRPVSKLSPLDVTRLKASMKGYKPANSMRINISTPIYHDGHVFASSAYGAGGGLAKLVRKRNNFV